MQHPEQCFWKHIGPHTDPEACWLWQDAIQRNRNGLLYGKFRAYGKNFLAHRFSYELRFGTIPKSLTIDHTCRNTLCMNPNHMEPVPNKINILRGISPPALNAQKTHCPKGHPYSEENTYSWPRSHSRQCRICRKEAQKRAKTKKSDRRTIC